MTHHLGRGESVSTRIVVGIPGAILRLLAKQPYQHLPAIWPRPHPGLAQSLLVRIISNNEQGGPRAYLRQGQGCRAAMARHDQPGRGRRPLHHRPIARGCDSREGEDLGHRT